MGLGDGLRLGGGALEEWLFISERSRLPVMMPVRDADRLAVALPLAVAEMLQSVGIDHDAIERECRLMSPMVAGRTASRNLVGSIDVVFMAQARLITGTTVPLFDIARWLADTPVMPFDGRHPSVDVLRQRVEEVAGVSPCRRRTR